MKRIIKRDYPELGLRLIFSADSIKAEQALYRRTVTGFTWDTHGFFDKKTSSYRLINSVSLTPTEWPTNAYTLNWRDL